MATGERNDPFLSYNFAVEIHGLVAGGFSEVQGLQLEIELHEYREGGVNGYVHKRAGPARYPSNLVLKRGLTDVRELWTWHWDVAQGKVERKDIAVLLLDGAGEERVRWTFQQAYPVKWVGPDLRGGASEVAVEAVEFTHCGLLQI
jgi:phage tail-like protein